MSGTDFGHIGGKKPFSVRNERGFLFRLTGIQAMRARSSRATKSACSGEFKPCWRIALTVAFSSRTKAAGSSHRPGNTVLRRMAVGRRGHQLEAPFAVHEPVDLAIKDPPDDVLADAVAPVGVQLFPEVVTGAAGRDFRDQLGRSLYVIILADAGLSTPLGPDDQVSVGLGFVIQVQADAAIVARLDPGRVRFIIRQPGNQPGMRVAVPPVSDR